MTIWDAYHTSHNTFTGIIFSGLHEANVEAFAVHDGAAPGLEPEAQHPKPEREPSSGLDGEEDIAGARVLEYSPLPDEVVG